MLATLRAPVHLPIATFSFWEVTKAHYRNECAIASARIAHLLKLVYVCVYCEALIRYHLVFTCLTLSLLVLQGPAKINDTNEKNMFPELVGHPLASSDYGIDNAQAKTGSQAYMN